MTFGRLAILCVAVSFGQSPSEQTLRDLLVEARRSTPERSAQLLIQADAVAEKMARSERPPDGLRRVRVESFELTYRWNGIAQAERYQHDLLKIVIREQEGRPEGANALVALLAGGGQDYRSVIGLLESKRWRALHDIRLDRILGEAYEMWWSLSRAKPSDSTLARKGEAARVHAIEAYERVLQVQPKDQELRRRVTELRARHDTRGAGPRPAAAWEAASLHN